MQEPHAPPGFLADLVKDRQDFFLFAAGDEAFAGDGEGAERDGGDAAIFDVGDDAAEVVRVRELHVVHLLRAGGHGWVGLGQEAHGGVVEHTGDDGGAFDYPGVVSLQHAKVDWLILPNFGKG